MVAESLTSAAVNPGLWAHPMKTVAIDRLSCRELQPDAPVPTTLSTEEAVENSVEVVLTPSAGYGVFATSFIPRGALVAIEAPLIAIPHVPDDDSIVEFCKALQETTVEKLILIDDLSCDDATLNVVNRSKIREEISQWYKLNDIPSTEDQSRPAKDTVEAVDEICRRYSIFLTNNLSMGEQLGRGIFPLFSRMNHSCRPNIYEYYWPSLHKLYIRASEDIGAGDQLFSTYISLLLPLRQRRKALKPWGFICQCSACLDSELEVLRDRSCEVDDTIEEFFYYAEDPADICETDEGPYLGNASEGVQAAQELIDLLQRQGLYGEPMFNACVPEPRYNANTQLHTFIVS